MIIATPSSVYEYEDKFDKDPEISFEKMGVRRVIEGEKIKIVAFVDNSIFVNSASGQHLQTGINDRIDSLCIVKEEPFTLLIGTTPPYLYRFNEEDVSAKRIEEFDNLEVRGKWYTPWGGPAAVRSLASTKGGWIYADIHVGSIMRSNNYGRNWEPVTPTLHKDVHEVSTTPASKTNVYANTFLSVYVSEDRGDNWKHKSKNLNNRYGRGLAVNPKDPNMILCGVSDGPTGTNVNGQLYYSEDRGDNWTHISSGFPKTTRKNIDTFHIAYMNEDIAWVSDEEKLYISRDGGRKWKIHWKAPEEILMISCK